MKQTAVDCLIEQLTNEGIYIPFGFYEQAKEMEKEQLLDMGYQFAIMGEDNPEQYYNETYNTKEK